MHSLIKLLLELHGAFRDGDVTWRGQSTLLDDLPFSTGEAARLEASSLEAIDSLS